MSEAVVSAIATAAAGALAAPLAGSVEERLRSLLLDSLAAIVMGTGREEGHRLLRSKHPLGACSIPGRATGVTLAEAARINAALCQVYDANDGRRMAWVHGGLWHPGRYVIPAALALAEEFNLPAPALLRLLAFGYDVAGKVQGDPAELAATQAVAAMHGAAAGLPPDAIRRALVLACFSFPRPPRWPDDRDLNHHKYGLIVRAGIQAAIMADEAADLPAEQCGLRLREALNLAGNDGHECLGIYLKPFPTCRSTHGPITLALALRPRIAASEIERIVVVIGDSGEPLARPFPAGAHYKRGQFSVPYTVACAWLDGEVGPAQFTQARMASADVQALQGRVELVQDPGLGAATSGLREPARMQVVARDGRIWEEALDIPPGSPLAPPTAAAIATKFRRWTAGVLTRAQQDHVIGAALSADAIAIGCALRASGGGVPPGVQQPEPRA